MSQMNQGDTICFSATIELIESTVEERVRTREILAELDIYDVKIDEITICFRPVRINGISTVYQHKDEIDWTELIAGTVLLGLIGAALSFVIGFIRFCNSGEPKEILSFPYFGILMVLGILFSLLYYFLMHHKSYNRGISKSKNEY